MGIKILQSVLLVLMIFIAAGLRSEKKDNCNTLDYDVKFYHIDLNVGDSSTFISGNTEIKLKTLISLSQVCFDFSNKLVTDSVVFHNEKLTFDHSLNKIIVSLKEKVNAESILNIKIYYHGLGKNIAVDSGIYNEYVSTVSKNVTWTLSEPFSAMQWFPCKQLLTDKADSVYVFLSTDKKLKAGSNGILSSEVELPGNRIRYEWKSKYPIAYYLISFTVCDYIDYSYYVKTGNDSVLVQNYVYNDSSYLKQYQKEIDKTSDLLDLFSKLFGPYPFKDEKYGHCTAPCGGGMEHQTMTTLVNFSFSLIGHELAHQWFGDLVTCSSWQDIWINEGFASYAEYLSYQYLVSQEQADSWISRNNNFIKSLPTGSVYVPAPFANDENRIFSSRLSYKKGASIIHMIRQEIGDDELFFDILKGFLNSKKYLNSSASDFKQYLELRTNKDFSQFFNQWFYGEGFPKHNIRWNQKNDTLYIYSLQTTSSVTPLFNIRLDFKVRAENKDTIISFRQTGNFNIFKAFVQGNVRSMEVDPGSWLLIDVNDISYLKQENNESEFSLNLNPSSDNIRIEYNGKVEKYSVFLCNNEGKIVIEREWNTRSNEININSLPSGPYFVAINNREKLFWKQFVKK